MEDLEKSEKDARRTRRDTALTVVLCFIMVLFGLGMWASKGLFVAPISEALGIERSMYAISDTMRFASTAIVNIFFGSLVGRFGAKRLILFGFLCLIASALLYAGATTVLLLYLGGMLLGIGLSFTGTTIVGYIINKTVRRNRGTVMGLILAANGVGGAIAAQFINIFLRDTADPFAYRKAFYMMAAVFATVLLLLLLFLKEPQATSDAPAKAKKPGRGSAWVGVEYGTALKKPYFYAAIVCIFFTGMVLQAVSGAAAAHMKDVGMKQDFISLVTSVSLVALATFKFLNGVLYDRLGLRAVITIDCTAALLTMACLYFITNSTFGMVLGISYAILASVALPLETVMIPIYANDLFGERSFNKVLGIFVSFNQIGYALAGPLINLSSDLLGSYKVAFILAAAIMLAVVITLQFIITAAHRTRRAIERAP